MADCHDLFQEYLDEICLSATKKNSLRTSRNANRGRIRDHFQDTLKKEVPKFYGQGSYMMHTMVNPIDDDFDIDDGVYLQGLGTDRSKWPSCETVHGWIIDATKGYTSKPPESKPACVRVYYQGGYHIDLPCYAMNDANVPMLFRKGKLPVESDPRAFTEWFQHHVNGRGEQQRNLVRYLKAWRDFQQGDALLVSGLGLTILASDHFHVDARDDISLVRTAEKIYAHLLVGNHITKPVTPYENLDESWTENDRKAWLKKMKNLVDRGNDALAEKKKSTASGIWRQLLGDRFPLAEGEGEESSRSAPLRTSAPAILGSDGRSA
jgi:cyclic GMP-AMP synthase DncV-like protein